jgi:hypothetical protein
VSTVGVQFVGPEPVAAPKGYVETWNGTGWSPTVSGNRPDAVSCTSPSFCIAVGTEGGAQAGVLTSGGDAFGDVFNGTSWTLTDFPLPAGSDNGLSGATLTSVACPASSCLATGTQQVFTVAPPGVFMAGPVTPVDAFYNGTAWSATAVPAPPTAPTGITCTFIGTCVGVGQCSSAACGGQGTPLIERLAGGAWSTVSLVSSPGSGSFESVSCGSRSRCMAVGGQLAPAQALAATGAP